MARTHGGSYHIQDIGYPDPGDLHHGASCLCVALAVKAARER
jgi:uncharacterized heparinase superfamily protein